MRQPCLSVVLYLFAALTATPVAAAILRVQSDAPGPAHDGVSWVTAYTAIQPAIDAAASGDEVWVAKGTYTGALTMKTGVALYGGFAGDETARTQRDFRANTTTIDGRKFVNNAQVCASAVTFPANATAATILDGFTVTNGTGTAAFGDQVCTGGICTNQYQMQGGGVYIAGGAPVVRNNIITGNGPVEGLPPTPGPVNYEIWGWCGGGVYVAPGSNPVIQANTISANLLDASITRHNRVDWGGGIYAATGSNPLIADNLITGNEAENGGGICTSEARILRNRILRNEASRTDYWGHSAFTFGNGGGIYCGSDAIVVGNLIAENNSIVWNNAIKATSGAGTGVLVNNTIVWNGPSGYSSVSFNGRLIANNIIAFNKGSISAPASTVLSHNDVYGTNYGSGILHPTDIQADPLFVDKDNGDYHLRPGSPCADAGDDTVDAGETDLDAEPRRSGAHIDIGADELLVGNWHAAFVQAPERAMAGVPITPAPTVAVQDASGAIITSFNGPVSLAIKGGTGAPGAALSGNTAQAVNGVADFPSLTVSAPGSGYVLVPSAVTLYGEALPAVDSSPFTVLPGAARLAFSVQPHATLARLPFDVQPVVVVQDVNGATVTEYNGAITLSILQGTGTAGATLRGATTVSAVNGVATFTNLSINWAGDGYVLTASATFISEAESAPFTVIPAIIHVRVDGNDTAHGTTWASALKTVQAGLDAAAAQGGAEVWVAEGTYRERLIARAATSLYGGFAGTEVSKETRDVAAHPTVLDAEQKGRVLRIPALPGPFVIDGFTITNGYVYLDWNHPTPEGSRGAGIYSEAGDLTVAHCTVRGNFADTSVRNSPYGSSQTDAEGGGLYQKGGRCEIRENTVNDNRAGGGAVGPGGGGGIFLTETTAKVAGNVFMSNGSSVCSYNSAVDLASNLFRNDLGAPAFTASYGELARPIVVRNNTFIGNSSEAAVQAYLAPMTIVNNVFYHNQIAITARKPDGIHHNLMFENGTHYREFSYPSGADPNVLADPKFVDASNGNYRLGPGSPAIDAGDDSTYTPGEMDLDDNPRKMGTHVDIGAYEFLTAGAFTMDDARRTLKIAAGLDAMAVTDVPLGAAADPSPVDLSDALAILRKVTGLSPNP